MLDQSTPGLISFSNSSDCIIILFSECSIAAIKMAVCLVDIIDETIVSVTALQPKLSQVAICLNTF